MATDCVPLLRNSPPTGIQIVPDKRATHVYVLFSKLTADGCRSADPLLLTGRLTRGADREQGAGLCSWPECHSTAPVQAVTRPCWVCHTAGHCWGSRPCWGCHSWPCWVCHTVLLGLSQLVVLGLSQLVVLELSWLPVGLS